MTQINIFKEIMQYLDVHIYIYPCLRTTFISCRSACNLSILSAGTPAQSLV